MTKVSILHGVIAALFCLGTVYADTWYVHPDSALNSIQAGIDSCIAGDIVLVGPGTYLENINFYGKAITVTSEYGPDTTIIDGGIPLNPDSASVVTFVSAEDTTSVLHGFKIINGSGTFDPYDPDGGGILCDNTAPTIRNNIITGNGNPPVRAGGGICCKNNSAPLIVCNTITQNASRCIGGGITCDWTSAPIITNNTIIGNMSGSGIIWSMSGAGIYCAGPATITGNTIANNTAYDPNWGANGGGIFCHGSPTIANNTITENTACSGGGIYCEGFSPIITENLIAHNVGESS